jgi:hypothetical protein
VEEGCHACWRMQRLSEELPSLLLREERKEGESVAVLVEKTPRGKESEGKRNCRQRTTVSNRTELLSAERSNTTYP